MVESKEYRIKELKKQWKFLLEHVSISSRSARKSGMVSSSTITPSINYLTFSCKTFEEVLWIDLLTNENPIFNKNIVIICQTCSNLESLSRLITEQYIPSILVYESVLETLQSYDDYEHINLFSNFMECFLDIKYLWKKSPALIKNALITLFQVLKNDKEEGIVSMNNKYNIIAEKLGNFIISLCLLNIQLQKTLILKSHLKNFLSFFNRDSREVWNLEIKKKQLNNFLLELKALENLFGQNNLKIIFIKLSKKLRDNQPIKNIYKKFLEANIKDKFLSHQINFDETQNTSHQAVIGCYVLFVNVFNNPLLWSANKMLSWAKTTCYLVRINLHFLNLAEFFSLTIYEPENFQTKCLCEEKSIEICQTICDTFSVPLTAIKMLRCKVIKWSISRNKLLCVVYRKREMYTDGEYSEFQIYSRQLTFLKDTLILLQESSILLNKIIFLIFNCDSTKIKDAYKGFNILLDCRVEIRSYFRQHSLIFSQLFFKMRIETAKFLKTEFMAINKNLNSSNKDPFKMHACQQALYIVGYPLSRQRCLIVLICLEIIFNKELKYKSGSRIYDTVKDILLFSNFDVNSTIVSDDAFLYFKPNFLAEYIRESFQRPLLYYRLKNIAYEAENWLNRIDNLRAIGKEIKNKIMHNFKIIVQKVVKNEIVEPICEQLEYCFRVTNLKQVINRKTIGCSDLRELMSNELITIYNIHFSLKDLIIEHFETKMYKEIILSPHKEKNAKDMLFRLKMLYKMDILPFYRKYQQNRRTKKLTNFCKDFGPNIEQFCFSRYDHALVEKTSKKNLIETISCKDIKRAIHTNGIGYTYFAFNCCYSGIKEDFGQIFKFFSDYRIRARLQRDESDISDKKMPLYGLAINLIKDMKGCAVADQPDPFLNFYQSVTRIGNMIGFFVLLKNGKSGFLNDQKSSTKNYKYIVLKKLAGYHSDACRNALTKYNNILETLSGIIQGNSDCFSVIIDIFNESLNKISESYIHLFYLTVPALIYLTVEWQMQALDKYQKKFEEATMVEDGTTLGIAFLLAVSGSLPAFENLNVFSQFSTKKNDKHKNDSSEIACKNAGIKGSVKHNIARLSMFEKNVNIIKSGYECARFSFSTNILEYFSTVKNGKKEKAEDELKQVE